MRQKLAFLIVTFLPIVAQAQWDIRDYPGSDFDGPAFVFEEIVEDVYHARGTGNLLVGSNAAIIVNEHDVMIVDSLISPVAAVALAAELQDITDKPIRYVVNTHFHFDHAHGNQVYPPDVEIIGHEYTREMLASGGSVGRSYETFRDWVFGAPGGADGQQGLEPTPPNVIMSERLTLERGGREIRLLHVGRGHTGGDVVVFLPAEKILVTGDLLLEGVPFMGDSYPADWIDTLEALKSLDFETVIPGHGHPFRDRQRIDRQQALLRSIVDEVTEACERGLSVEDAAAALDLSAHSDDYAELAESGAPPLVVQRIYELNGCR